jgi:mRNA-degrading endonuclease RelE of RelBE toxin-antitoxin system
MELMSNPAPIQIFATLAFKSQLRKLSKRYRSLSSDLQSLLDELSAGQTPGDPIPGTSAFVFKVRLKNSDIQKGKSGGYRVIYQCRGSICLLLVTLYSKSDQSTVTAQDIKAIIRQFDLTIRQTPDSQQD